MFDEQRIEPPDKLAEQTDPRFIEDRVSPTPEQEAAVWQGLLNVEQEWCKILGRSLPHVQASEVQNAANRITHCGHASFMMDVIRRRGGGFTTYEGRLAAVSSRPFCTVPGYESYRAVD